MTVIARIAKTANTPRKASALRTVGFACDRLWVHLLFFSAVPFAQTSDVTLSLFSNMLISLVALAAALLGFLAFHRKVAGLLLSKYFICIGVGACLIGTALLSVTELSTMSGIALAICCGISTGLGSAILYLGWVRIFGCERLESALKELSCAVAASFGVAVLCALCGQLACLVALLVAPLFSGTLLRACSFVRSPRNDRQGRAAGAPSAFTPIRARRSLGILAFGAVAGFANILCSNRMYARDDIFNSWLLLAGFIIAVVIAMLTVLQGSRAVRQAHRLALLLMAVGCMTIALSPDTATQANMLTYAGFSTFGTMLLMLALALGKNKGADPTRTVCATVGCVYLGEVAGLVAGHLAQFSVGVQVPLNQIGFALTIILIVSYLFLLTETDLAQALRPKPAQQASEADNAPAAEIVSPEHEADAFEERCKRISETYALSPREREVLPLLLRGRTIARIQEELFISASTVNTHIRHIYTKCEVANKQELLDLFEQRF